MAVSWLAEKIVSHLLDAVLGNLTQEMKSIWGVGVEDELKKLERKVKVIQDVIEDAEEKQFHSKAVGSWLRELKNIAYDADDILDDVATEALQLSALRDQGQTSKRQKVGVFHYISPIFQNKRDIAREIREISGRLDVIAKERHDLNLEIRRDGGRRLQIEQERRETSSLVDESDVIGRQVDKDKIIQLLVSDDDDDDKLYSVIPIVGMGGLGKTTLAQFVYNDHRVKTHFGLRAWACVSEDFNVLRITNAIIESASGSTCGLSNLDAAQRHLQEKLNAERYLVVLDDVWGENQIHNWDRLRAPFGVGVKGSKIIMTTRDERVARTMATIPSHDLQGLPDDDCWELFTRRVFAGRISNAHPELEEIGRQIVKKCNGLPLAVKTLGGILSSKRNVSEWKSILTSEIWKDDKSDILPALRLSYRYLPTDQKQCFAYSAAFPKDHEFEKDVLVRQWMAAGFIQPKGSTLLEDIGGEIFDDLLLKSFFQFSHHDNWETSLYVMHDLMHDLAESISGDECFRLEDGTSQTIPEMAHHLSWIDVKEGSMSLEALKKFKRLRTLRLKAPSSINNQILNDALMELRCLRVLDLSWSKFDKLPDSIVHLKHLRYLDLTDTEIDGLPESMSNLCNLQTLGLSLCNNLKGLPDSIGHLKHLRCLHLSHTKIDRLPESVTSLCNLQTLGLEFCSSLKGLPKGITNLVNLQHIILDSGCWDWISVPGIGKLTSLQTLEEFEVCKESGCQIGELKNMRNIKGRLKISGLEDVQNIEEAKEANLKDKKSLNELSLNWDSSEDGRVNYDGVLECLQPHANLKELHIKSYGGVSFPSWMSHLSNLTCITIEDCRNCEHLFPLDCQLPSLCNLYLHNCPKLQVLPANLPAVTEFHINGCGELSALPMLPSICDLGLHSCGVKRLLSLKTPCLTSLQRLSIGGCDQLECCLEEVSLQDLTSLQHLQIFDCPLLKSLGYGEGLPTTLKFLQIDYCPNLKSMPTRLENLTSLLELSIVTQLPLFSQESALPTTIVVLKIFSCDNLMSLPKGMQSLTSLKKLVIHKCPQLNSLFSDDENNDYGLPTELNTLEIHTCPNLKSLPKEMQNLASLKTLIIHECPQLHSLFLDDENNDHRLPTTLITLNISAFPNLKSLPKGMQSLLPCLKELIITDCPQFNSLFPDDEYNGHGLPTTLNKLEISTCPNLKSLPNRMQNLTSLISLTIFDCPEISSLPEGGLPTTLKNLAIASHQVRDSKPNNSLMLKSTEPKKRGVTRCGPRSENDGEGTSPQHPPLDLHNEMYLKINSESPSMDKPWNQNKCSVPTENEAGEEDGGGRPELQRWVSAGGKDQEEEEEEEEEAGDGDGDRRGSPEKMAWSEKVDGGGGLIGEWV
ncbi:putative disease resistance protein RGA3 [Tasmannia lanceolata]|uniref:putative disease resistance protein RGA3 n=1 Tax=Tasmannia lanceolata TaxID=3420 RepID=UPI004062D533